MPASGAMIADIQEATFSTQTERKGDAVWVTMKGNADSVVSDRLKAFLDDVHRAAGAWNIREAVFELHDLYFMNSSCLSLFLRLINVILESRIHKYSLRFRSNRNLRWQQKSLQAILSYAGEIVTVE
jgi:anti-anti-sigma factor